jgi:hypothetical protein
VQLKFPVAADPTITVGTGNSISIDPMFNLIGGVANATVSGLTITVPQQTINIQVGDIIFSGSGTMNSAMNSFTINYDYENTAPLVGGTGSCSATYTK